MRTTFMALIALALTVPMTPPVSAAQEVGAPLALKLLCEGDGLTAGTFQNAYRARVYLHINGASGDILIPHQLVGGLRPRDTWHPLRDLAVGQEKITARVRFNVLGSTHLVLDRINGELDVNGTSGHFVGTCAPYDPDNVRRAF